MLRAQRAIYNFPGPSIEAFAVKGAAYMHPDPHRGFRHRHRYPPARFIGLQGPAWLLKFVGKVASVAAIVDRLGFANKLRVDGRVVLIEG